MISFVRIKVFFLQNIQVDKRSFKNVKGFKEDDEAVQVVRLNIFSKMKLQSVQEVN